MHEEIENLVVFISFILVLSQWKWVVSAVATVHFFTGYVCPKMHLGHA